MQNIHPITVHFTISLFTLSIMFEIFGWIFKKDSLKSASWWNLLIANVAAIASVITGLNAASSAPHDEAIHKVIEIHQTLGYVVLVSIIILFLWRTIAKGKWAAKLLPLYLGIAVVAVVIMLLGGYYGGELVYTHGVGVKPVMATMALEDHDHSAHGSNKGDDNHSPAEADVEISKHDHDTHGTHDH